MWACPDDLIDMYSELSPPISSTQVYNNADLSVSDLRIEPFETLLHSKIDDFVTKWQALDTTMLRKKKKREGNRGRLVGSMHLALPFGLDLWDIKGSFRNTKHDRIPEECKEEYYRRLDEIFREVPRQSQFKQQIMMQVSDDTRDLTRNVTCNGDNGVNNSGRSASGVEHEFAENRSKNGSSNDHCCSNGHDSGGRGGGSHVEQSFELETAKYKHYLENSMKSSMMKSELHGLYNEVQEDANCSDPPAQESAKKRPGGKEEPTLLLHPRPRPDRREICEKSSQGDNIVIRVSLHSVGLTSEKSSHTGIEHKTCPENKEQEYELLGSNNLLELRESIYCVQDSVNESPQVSLEQPSRQQAAEEEASYFFIEGVFYVHESEQVCAQLTREVEEYARDLSASPSCGEEGILGERSISMDEEVMEEMHYCRAAKWVARQVQAEESAPPPAAPVGKRKRVTAPASSTFTPATAPATPKRGRPQKQNNRKPNISSRFVNSMQYNTSRDSEPRQVRCVEFRPMKGARLGSLRFRVGARYLYCHLNACEHFMYFSDVHLRVPDNTSPSSGSDMYPKLLYRGHMWRRLCGVCNLWSAKCVVYDDRLASENPTFYCQHCYHLLHYDNAGRLLYNDFKVFPYLHDMV